MLSSYIMIFEEIPVDIGAFFCILSVFHQPLGESNTEEIL